MRFKVKPIHAAVACHLVIIGILALLGTLALSDPTTKEIAKIAVFITMCAGIYINLKIARWQWREARHDIKAELEKDTSL